MNNLSDIKILPLLKKLWGRGLFHMFGTKILNQAIVFCSGVILVRVLSKENYGIYTYVQNTLSFFLLLDGLGATSGLLQYGSKSYESSKFYSYFSFSIKQGILSNLIVSILIICYGIFVVNDPNLKYLFIISSFLPVINIVYNLSMTYNIVSRDSSFYSKITLLNSFLLAGGMILGAILWKVVGVFIFSYITNIISLIIIWFHLKHNTSMPKHSDSLTRVEVRDFFKFSAVAVSSNAVSHLVFIIDVFLISIIISNMNIIAAFKTATIIPFGLMFIPSTMMIFLYPYFAKNSDNKIWIKTNYVRIIVVSCIVFGIITLIMITSAKSLIPWIFGKEYIDSVYPFIVLSIGFFVAACFRIPAGNTLAALGKVKVNLFIAAITGTLNIILDLILIKNYGSNGASWASLMTFIISALIGNLYIYKFLRRDADKPKVF